MDLVDAAQDARADKFGVAADRGMGPSLVAHLRGDAFAGGCLGEPAGFLDRVGEGFLAVDVFAELDRPHGGQKMHVVRRRDRHCVDVAADRVEHPPKIAETLRAREPLAGLGGAGVVHVAQRDDVLGRAHRDIGPALAADADAGDGQAAVRAEHTGGRHEREGERAGREGGALEERAACLACLHGDEVEGPRGSRVGPRRREISSDPFLSELRGQGCGGFGKDFSS